MADITYWVYQCNGTRSTATEPFSNPPLVYPTCTPASNGGWIQVQQVNNLPFDPATLDAETLGQAYASGFIVMGLSIIATVGIAQLIKLIKGV